MSILAHVWLEQVIVRQIPSERVGVLMMSHRAWLLHTLFCIPDWDQCKRKVIIEDEFSSFTHLPGDYQSPKQNGVFSVGKCNGFGYWLLFPVSFCSYSLLSLVVIFYIQLTCVPSVLFPSSVPSVLFPSHVPSVLFPSHVPSVLFPSSVPSVLFPSSVPSVLFPSCVPSVLFPSCVPSVLFPSCVPTVLFPSCVPNVLFPSCVPNVLFPSCVPSVLFPSCFQCSVSILCSQCSVFFLCFCAPPQSNFSPPHLSHISLTSTNLYPVSLHLHHIH